MRRNLIMDLFFGDKKELVGEWHNFPEERPKKSHTKVFVKLKNNDELFAYFHDDKRGGSFFWNCSTKEPLNEVTMWKNVE